MDADAGLSSLGRWSRWHVVMCMMLNVTTWLPASMHMLAIVFLGMEPPFHCAVPPGVSLNESIPPDENNPDKLDQCNVYINFSSDTNATQPCPMGYIYEGPLYTIVNEWGLTCDRSFLVSTSQTVLVGGVMVGAMLMGMVADKIGRKPVLLGSVIAISLLALLTAALENYVTFVVLRFLTGIFQQGVLLVGYVITCELFPASERTLVGLLIQCFWAFGMLQLVLLAYVFPNWRHLMVAISLFGLPALPLLWLLPESVPWLVAKNRIPEAKRILQKAARFNKVQLPAEFQLSEEEENRLTENRTFSIRKCAASLYRRKNDEKSEEDYTIISILKSRKLLMFALIMCYLWCVSALVYYGLSLSTGSLAGNPYLNFFFSGIVEIPAYLLSAAFLHFIGRRWPICIFHIIAGVPLFITMFIPSHTASGIDLVPLIVTLSMIGKFGITVTFGSIFLYAPELFPTTVRNLGLGIASVGARIGSMASPSTSLVASYIPWLPNLVFGVMALVAGLLTLLLPETLNRALPQSIKEVEKWPRTPSKDEKRYLKMIEKSKKSSMEVKDKTAPCSNVTNCVV